MAKKQLGPTTRLYPMPTMLVAVRTGEGTANILTVAWGGVVGGEPPMLALSIDSNHYSSAFIDQEGNLTVNIPRSAQVAGADYCGLVSGRQDPDKPGACGWTMVPSTRISSPLIAECPLNFECRIIRKVEAGEGSFYLLEVVETHVDEEALADGQVIDALALDPLIFTPDGYYHKLGPRVGRGWDAGNALKRP